MSAIIGSLWEGYKFIFYELPDQRTISWFLVSKPYQGLTILGLYLMFVLKWGPRFMKDRPPYNLDKVLIVYNFLQVVACIYVFYQAMAVAWAKDYKWVCEPIDRSNFGKPLEMAEVCYWYFVMKVIDLLDTVFFVQRKKSNQVSFLHIYHHTGMVMLIWGAVTYLPGGHGTLIGVINTFVHIVMYSYYLFTVVKPSAKQSLWWKKYITQLQILQFLFCVLHMLVIVFKPDCAYPRWTCAVFLPQNCFILVLFVDFYIKTYINKPQANQSEWKTEEEQKTVLPVESSYKSEIINNVYRKREHCEEHVSNKIVAQKNGKTNGTHEYSETREPHSSRNENRNSESFTGTTWSNNRKQEHGKLD